MDQVRALVEETRAAAAGKVVDTEALRGEAWRVGFLAGWARCALWGQEQLQTRLAASGKYDDTRATSEFLSLLQDELKKVQGDGTGADPRNLPG